MALDAVPPHGGLADALHFLRQPAKVVSTAREATAWVEQALQLVRQAADPNPWRDASDEDIAAEILRRIEDRKS
jgi:hypothetical protein